MLCLNSLNTVENVELGLFGSSYVPGCWWSNVVKGDRVVTISTGKR